MSEGERERKREGGRRVRERGFRKTKRECLESLYDEGVKTEKAN